MNSSINQIYNNFNKILQAINNNELPLNVIDISFITDFFSFFDEANSSFYKSKPLYEEACQSIKKGILNDFKSDNLHSVAQIIQSILLLFPTIDDALLENEASSIYHYSEISKLIHFTNKYRNVLAYKSSYSKAKKDLFVGKGVIYTAIIGGYDRVPIPTFINHNLDYLLFTDNPNLQSDIWKVIYVEKPAELDSSRFSRIFKLLGHKYLAEYDYSIWIDGKILISGDPLEYINQNKGQYPILFLPHFARNCAYEEAKICLDLGRGDAAEIQKQIDRYHSEGFPEYYGLIEGCVIVRDLHDEKLNDTMETWWNEIANESGRDQISFGYSFWKNNMPYDTSNISIANNPFFTVTSHIKA